MIALLHDGHHAADAVRGLPDAVAIDAAVAGGVGHGVGVLRQLGIAAPVVDGLPALADHILRDALALGPACPFLRIALLAHPLIPVAEQGVDGLGRDDAVLAQLIVVLEDFGEVVVHDEIVWPREGHGRKAVVPRPFRAQQEVARVEVAEGAVEVVGCHEPLRAVVGEPLPVLLPAVEVGRQVVETGIVDEAAQVEGILEMLPDGSASGSGGLHLAQPSAHAPQRQDGLLRRAVGQLRGAVAVVGGSVGGQQHFRVAHLEGRPVRLPVPERAVIQRAVQVDVERVRLLLAHVAPVLPQLPGEQAVEAAVQIHVAGESVGIAACAGVRVVKAAGDTCPHSTAVRGYQVVELVAHRAHAPQVVVVVGLEVEGILPHPAADANVGHGVAHPLVVAEVGPEALLREYQRAAALGIEDDALAEVVAPAVVHLHPGIHRQALCDRQVVDARDVHIGAARLRQAYV